MTQSATTRDAVVLVHGLAANHLVMAPLARALRRAYSQVVNWGYSSLWSPIERHGQRLAALIKGLEEQAERVHLVTHSMGGIITRLALAEFQPQRLGRLVMVAPPNRGSHVATWLAPWLGRICPPLIQLADYEDSLVCRLPLPQVPELGVIAAATDFLVHEPSTHLRCETDHITLPGLHSSLLWRRETAEQVQHFLEHGRFRRAASTNAAA
jgi:Predicted acetyltransferases and hydrolases with the alpha/beta hydrolase fold